MDSENKKMKKMNKKISFIITMELILKQLLFFDLVL